MDVCEGFSAPGCLIAGSMGRSTALSGFGA